MTEHVDDPVPALLAGEGDPQLADALFCLRAAGNRPAPVPTPELQALLTAAAPADDLAGRRRHRAGRLAAGVVVAGAATLALSGVAAAHDALPGPAQHVVTSIVDELTPFDIAAPHASPDRPAPRVAPATGTPKPLAPTRPVPGSSTPAGPGDRDDRGGEHPGTGTGEGSGEGSRGGSRAARSGSDDGGRSDRDGGTGGGGSGAVTEDSSGRGGSGGASGGSDSGSGGDGSGGGSGGGGYGGGGSDG